MPSCFASFTTLLNTPAVIRDNDQHIDATVDHILDLRHLRLFVAVSGLNEHLRAERFRFF